MLHTGDTLRNDQFRCIRDFLSKRFSDLCVGSGIYGAGTVVQNQDFRFLQKRPGDTKPLLLTAGDIAAALIDPGVVSVRKTLNKFIGTSQMTSLGTLLRGSVFLAPAKII